MLGNKNKTNGTESTEVIGTPYHYVIAGVYALLFVTAIGLNTPVVVTFIKDRTLRTRSNMLIFSIAIGDWLQALAYPLGIVLNVSGIWREISDKICIWYAFITAFLAFGIMLHYATFAIERALIVNFAVATLSVRKKLKFVIFGMWGFALLWSLFPLFGWSGYAPEGDSALCSIRWQSADPHDIAYIVCIFLFFFVVPIIVIVTSYCLIYHNVKKITKHALEMWGENAAPTQEAIQAEVKTARMAFLMSFCFLFAWTPYAIVSLYAVIGKPQSVSPLVATLPALFAKTAPCYNPVIYFYLFKKFRYSLRQVMRPLCGRFMKADETSAMNIEFMTTYSTGNEKNDNDADDELKEQETTINKCFSFI